MRISKDSLEAGVGQAGNSEIARATGGEPAEPLTEALYGVSYLVEHSLFRIVEAERGDMRRRTRNQ